MPKPRLKISCAITLLGFSLLLSFLAEANATSADTEVIERYEQILERAPMEGPSFDKLVQIYEQGDGLEKLDARWAPLSSQPGSKGATYSLLRGLLADRLGKTDDTRHLLQAATQTAPDDFHGWLALGDFESRQGKWTDAITALQKGLATPVTGDDRLTLYRKLGQAQQRNLDPAAALATWQKMVAEFPKDPFTLEEAGSAELDAEQFDEAKKTFQQLVDLTEPNSMNRVQALMRLAEVDDRQGKTDAAVHDYEAILPLTAESSWLNRELRAQIEQVYRREDDLAGLVTYYQKWTQDNPKDVEAMLLLSGALTELGKKPEALDALRKAAALAPERHEVRESLAQGLVEAKQYDEAITVTTALTADDPTEPRYWETLGDAIWLKTQPPTPDSTKATLDAWHHIDPPDTKDVAAILEVADLCRDHQLNDDALAGYRRALALSPDASDIREKAVKLLVDLKREDEAWKLLDDLVAGPQATAANFLKLAQLQQEFGRKDAAMDAIQKGLALEPNNFDLLSLEWDRLANDQKWPDAIALFDKLIANAPDPSYIDQIEARQLQTLTSAGKLDDTLASLRAKLGASPGLSESQLRILLRIMVQQSDPDISKALDEAHRLFPQSISLIRIEIDYNRHAGNFDAAAAALQRLIDTVPQQKTDWLTELVHVREDQGDLDDALKAAQQIIDASPANASGYLLYAELAFAANKADDAVAKLQAAIKLSDKPNEVRQRLARYYLESGQPAKARTIDDDAFAAADNQPDKLAIVRAMAAAYFEDGQIDELINRFKDEQKSEEGGWRYGLYLSAIDEQMEDYGAARRELAKSLAVRPNDAGLLHSLIGLAEKEGDTGELLKYRETLAAADPSADNEIALANEYAAQDKPDQAWQIVQKNSAEIVKDPLAWKDVLNQISNPDYAAKIKSVLEDAIRAKGDSFDAKFALAQFQMQQGDLENAKSTLWEILSAPLPAASPSKPIAPTNVAPGLAGTNSLPQNPFALRATQSYLALDEARQLLAPAQSRNPMRRMMSMSRMYNPTGVSTVFDSQAIKDHALVYLSAIAVQQNQAADFLKDLQTKIAAWHWSLSERIVAYAMIQAREPLLESIEEEANSTRPDKDLDQLCSDWCGQYQNQGVDDASQKRAEAAQALIEKRLEQAPQSKGKMALAQIYRLGAGNSSPEDLAKRKALVDAYVKTVDRKDPEQLIEVLSVASLIGDWDEIQKTVTDLAATDRSKWSVTTTQQLGFLPMSMLQQAATTQQTMPKQVVPVLMALMRMTYPTTPPHAPMSGGTSPFTVVNGFYYAGYNTSTFPPPNRYFPQERIGNLEPMFQQLKARDLLPEMYAALDQEEKELTDWRKVYPQLTRIYFQWWDDKKDEAIAAVRQLLAQDASDDNRLLLAAMLTGQQKYDEAIPILESVTARFGPDYIHVQMQLLHTARLAKNNDAGQKAGLRLLALRLPQQELMQILDDLREVGLKDKAEAIMAKRTGSQPGMASRVANMQGDQQLMRTLNEAVRKKDQAQVLDLAHQILNRDPLAAGQSGYANMLRDRALTGLKRSGLLDAYTDDVAKQLALTPDSIRLNWLAAEAYLHEGEASGYANNAANFTGAATTTNDSMDKAVTYFKKVAALDPKNNVLLVQIAQKLHQAKRSDAAADLYASLLKSDFNTGMTQYGNVLQSFQDSNRLPELMKIIQDWTPQPFNPMNGGGGMDMYFVMAQLGNQLQQNNHLPEAEQVYRKALAMQTFQSKQDLVTALVQLLINENRLDDAATEIEKWILDKNALPPAPPPLLGFSVPSQPQNTWFQAIGWNQDGTLSAPIIHFLELADQLGLSTKLRQELQARVSTPSASSFPNPIDQNQLAAILLAIMAHDPGYKADVEKLLKENSTASPTLMNNANAFLILSQQIARWPQERPMALHIANSIYDGLGSVPNNYFRNFAGFQVIRIAQAAGDHKTAQQTLRKIVQDMRDQQAMNPNMVQLDQALMIVRWMIRESMFKDAADLLDLAKSSPQLANNNTYYQQKMDQVQNELAFAKGDSSPFGLVYGLAPGPVVSDDKEPRVEFFWQINAGLKQTQQQNNNPLFSNTLWNEDVPARPTSCQIEVLAGPDEDHLTHLVSYSNVATQGHMPFSVSDSSTQIIKAQLVLPNPLTSSTTGAPTVGQVIAATGQPLLIGHSENILTNPNLAVSKNASGKSQIVGWSGLVPAAITEEAGGPLPVGGYHTIESSGNFGGGFHSDIHTERIPIQPDTNYVLSGWISANAGVNFQYLDADGKQLSNFTNGFLNNEDRWQWRAYLLKGNSQEPTPGPQIPPQTAFLEISFTSNSDWKLAGLSFRTWPGPAPAPAPAR